MSTTQGRTGFSEQARELASSEAYGADANRAGPGPGKLGQLMRRMVAAYVRRFEQIGRIPLE